MTLEQSRVMYNLTVDEAHTFFVGDGQWLVHNSGGCPTHVVLGLEAHGLEDTAQIVNGTTLMNDKNWMTTLETAIANPNTTFTFATDGLKGGESTYTQVMGAVQRAASGRGSNTDWELFRLHQSGRIEGVNFVNGGKTIPNPFSK